MTTVQWILLDDLLALLGIAAWFTTAVTAALRRYRLPPGPPLRAVAGALGRGRYRLAAGLLIGAVVATLARAATVAALSGRGGWFVQEKIRLGLPLLAAA